MAENKKGIKLDTTEDLEKGEKSVELVVNDLVIHHWHRLPNKGPEMDCDYWDCGHKIKHGDKYGLELYPDNHAKVYCLDCSSFFLAQALNELVTAVTKDIIPTTDKILELAGHGDFANGVTAEGGIDEGRVRGYEYLKELEASWLKIRPKF